MLGVEIGGQLNCKSAVLTDLVLSGSRIGGHAYLDEGFTSSNLVHLAGMEFCGQLVCDDASVRSLSVVDTVIARDFIWTRIRNPDEASLRMLNVTIEGFRDDPASWPRQNNLAINGLSVRDFYLYQKGTGNQLEAEPLRGTERISWLNLQGGNNVKESQPWIHIAKLLEQKGNRRDAKRVMFDLHRQEAAAKRSGSRIGWALFGGRILFARIVEEPLRILYFVAFWVAWGTALFWPLKGHFAPTSEVAYKTTYVPDCKPTGLFTLIYQSPCQLRAYPVAYPRFNPFIYALENNLPIVKLGQDDRFAPDPKLCSPLIYRSLTTMRWVLILVGWAQGIVLAAAVSARFRD